MPDEKVFMRERIAESCEKGKMNGVTKLGTDAPLKKMGKELCSPLCNIYNEPITNKYTVLEEIGR